MTATDAISIVNGQTAIAGDVNGDGTVTFRDYIVLESKFGKSNMDWWSGDLNGDGVVNFKDYVVLEANFGKSAGVPEPSLLAAVLAAFAALRRKKQR